MKRTKIQRKTSLRRSAFRRGTVLSLELRAFRAAVLARAAGRCERCGERATLDAHHIVPRSRAPGWAGLHRPENGAALCRPCHRGVHERVGDWKRWLKSAPRPERAVI